jgi:phage terminase large subunit-like protein
MGFKEMTPAVDVLERLVVQQKMRHGLHPVLTMAAANAVVVRDPAGGRKLDKARSSGRIDPLVALAMALSQATIKAEREVDVESLIG